MFELTRNGKIAVLSVAVPITAMLLYWLLRKTDDEDDDKVRNQSSATSRQTVIEMPIPRKAVGSIIGRQGATIKELQNKTGAKMNFREDGQSDDTDRTIVIRGTPETAQSAECLIRKILADLPVIVQDEMMVPGYALGRIIGRGGESVRQMSRASKTKIYIDRTRDGYKDKPRLITICGTKEDIVVAKSLIQEKLDEEEEFRAKSAVDAANKDTSLKTKASKSESHAPIQNMNNIEVSPMNEHWETSTDVKCQGRLQYCQFPQNRDYVDVYVSAIASPSHFWVQTVTPMSLQLDTLSMAMTRYYENEGKDLIVTSVEVGDIVAAPFENDTTWYRAQVMGVKEKQLDLFYVDYGDSSYLDITAIRTLSSEFLALPCQAVECRLADVKCRDVEWSEQAFDKFEELTHCAKWKVVVSKAVRFIESIPYLTLVDTNTQMDVNINEELVKQGFAVFESNTR